LCSKAVDAILKLTAVRRSADNLTVVVIAFDNFFDHVRKSEGNISQFEHEQIDISMIDL